jgi:hypothetical protein
MTKDSAEGKLAPKWECHYQVVRCQEKGAYHLKFEIGKILPRAWNAKHLRNTICNHLCSVIFSSIKQVLHQFILKYDKASSAIYLIPFLEQLERVMEGIPRGLSTLLPSSEDSKEL